MSALLQTADISGPARHFAFVPLPDSCAAAKSGKIAMWAAAVPAFAQTDSDTNGTGTSHGFAVSDGDTVKFGRQRVRLFGIDAPEKGQPCDDGHWYPGPLATKALVAFIAGRPVSCHEVDYDHKNNRAVAVCFAGKDDLQAMMARSPIAAGKWNAKDSAVFRTPLFLAGW